MITEITAKSIKPFIGKKCFITLRNHSEVITVIEEYVRRNVITSNDAYYITQIKSIRQMKQYKEFRKKQTTYLRPFEKGEILPKEVSISEADKLLDSPKVGDYIAVSPRNHNDMWLVEEGYMADNYEIVDGGKSILK